MTFTPDQYAKFIESLKVTKEPDKFYRLLEPGKDTWQVRDEFWSHNHGGWYSIAPDRIGLIVGSGYYGQITKIDKDVIGRRTESNAKPSDLAERVKGFMRVCLHVATEAANHPNNEDKQRPYEQLQVLCAEG